MFWFLQSVNSLGLTATPDSRSDKFDKVSHWYIGPCFDTKGLIKSLNLPEVIYRGTIEIVNYKGDPLVTKNGFNALGMQCAMKTYKNIQSDEYRIKMICDKIKKLIDINHYIVGFSSIRNYVYIIAEYLQVNYSITAGILLGKRGKKISDESIEEAKNARVILTTYKYFAIGVSIPRVSALMYLTGEVKIAQSYGRAFRGFDTSVYRYIYDIVDVDTHLKSYARRREKFYIADAEDNGRKLDIVKKNVSYEDIKL